MIDAVLFDFNGVLVDDEGQHCEAMQQVLAEEGIALTREQYYAQILGFDDRTAFVEAYRRAQRTVTTDLLKILVARKSQVYFQLVAKSLRLVPGATEFVHEAAKRFRLAIVSGALRQEIDHVLAQTGFAERFEVVVAAEDVSRCKPDPAPLSRRTGRFLQTAADQRRPLRRDRRFPARPSGGPRRRHALRDAHDESSGAFTRRTRGDPGVGLVRGPCPERAGAIVSSRSDSARP